MNTDSTLREKFNELPEDAFETWSETGTRRLIEEYALHHVIRIDEIIPRSDAIYPSRLELAQLLQKFARMGYLVARVTGKLPTVRFGIDEWTDIELYRDIEKVQSGQGSLEVTSEPPVFSRLMADSIGFLTSHVERETLRVLYEIHPPEHHASVYVYIFKNAFARGISVAVAEALVHGETLFMLPIFPAGLETLFEHYVHIASLPDNRRDVTRIKHRMREILRIRANDTQSRVRNQACQALAKLSRDNHYSALPSYETSTDSLFETRSQLVASHHVQALIDLAIAKGSSERYQEATQLCCDALSLDPDNMQALRNLGLSLFRIGLLDEAEKYTLRASRNESNWQGLALLDQANILSSKDAFEQSAQAILDAIRCGIVIDESIQARIMIDSIDVMIQHDRCVEALTILDAAQPILRMEPGKQARGEVFRLIGAIALHNIDAAHVLYASHRDTALENLTDTLILLRKLCEESELHSEFIDFCTMIYSRSEKNESLRYVPIYFVFCDLIHQFESASLVVQQIDQLLRARTEMQVRFRSRFVDLMQAAILSAGDEMEFAAVMRLTDDFTEKVVQIACRTLSPVGFFYPELTDILLSAMSHIVDQVLPWPSDFKCQCGEDMHKNSFCICGYDFPNLNQEVVTRIPVQKLKCPRCGDVNEGFRCDTCGRVYSWLLPPTGN